jgi:hypothetical protein
VKSILTNDEYPKSLQRKNYEYSKTNLEMGYAAKGVDICWFCFSCYWTDLFCSQLFLQTSLWRLEFLEDFSILPCQLHPHHFICKQMATLNN